ncbi:MAG: hypothetical protein ACPK85_04660 [Methanosarcina sp.]
MQKGKYVVLFFTWEIWILRVKIWSGISDRLEKFRLCWKIKVKKIGLTYEQVQTYNPPSNPAKFSDLRPKDYIAKYGPVSWEVDALIQEVLA